MKTCRSGMGGRWIAALLVSGAAGALACSSSSGSPGGSEVDAGATSSSGGSGSSSGSPSGSGSSSSGSGSSSSGAGSSSGASSGSSSGASNEGGSTCGSPLGPDGGVCNAVSQVGSPVTETCATGTPPTMTGGTLVDGTYVLTSATSYSCGDGGANPPIEVTAVVSGGCLNIVIAEMFEGGTEVATSSAQFVVSGNTFTSTPVCPSSQPPTTGTTYTATATTVTTLTSSGVLEVLTKQ